jgi:hypothetical protein
VRICLDCSIDLATGEEIPAVICTEAPAPEDRPPVPAGTWLRFGVLSCVPGLFSPAVLLLALMAEAVSVAVLAFSLLVLSTGGLFAGVLMAALALIVHGQAVAWLVAGRLATLADALVELDTVRWAFFLLLTFVPFSATFLLAIMPA